jgi:16S rRNA (uracil1498-N3)-methyltransferase
MSELGVSKIVPFNCERAGLKPNDVKTDKMQKVANMAIKQCDMSKPLKVEEVCSFADMLTKLGEFDEVYFAYEAQNASNVSFVPSGKNIAVVVGSIGGFSEEEANKIKSIKSVKPVSLGKRIMRVETACTSLCAVLMQASGEWK